jgi:hypothetical protein
MVSGDHFLKKISRVDTILVNGVEEIITFGIDKYMSI